MHGFHVLLIFYVALLHLAPVIFDDRTSEILRLCDVNYRDSETFVSDRLRVEGRRTGICPPRLRKVINGDKCYFLFLLFRVVGTYNSFSRQNLVHMIISILLLPLATTQTLGYTRKRETEKSLRIIKIYIHDMQRYM